MPRLFKSICLISFLLFFCSICVFAAEDITITTYYPSPYGVYNELQLYAHSPAVTTCDDAHKGTMYYNSVDNQVYVCKGTTLGWQALGSTKTSVLTVRDAGGSADCTITVVGGIITASTC
ncbi:MAG: hypothetical protein Q8N62_00185 [Candidatus Omnitrophota bacterium]|nr:hypothetical protein [Candidatus Omnitrophota bacterium]